MEKVTFIDPKYEDVCATSLGIQLKSSNDIVVCWLINTGDRLPTSYEAVFYSAEHSQSAVQLEVFEKHELAGNGGREDNRLAADVAIDLVPMPLDSPIQVTFRIETDGRLIVTAAYLRTQMTLPVQVLFKGVMTDDEIIYRKRLIQSMIVR